MRKKLVKLTQVFIVTVTVSALLCRGVIFGEDSNSMTPDQAKKILVDGNRRYLSEKYSKKDISLKRRKELFNKGQAPFAVIVSCSDSRVPPELVFDQGLGNLFVVRTAGNVVDAIGIGSVEYGVEHLHAQLIVVMGHDKCGAVEAAVVGGNIKGNIGAILSKIKPSVVKAKATGAKEGDLVEMAENENIKNTIKEIKQSPVVKELIKSRKVKIIGAKYHLASGKVEFMKLVFKIINSKCAYVFGWLLDLAFLAALNVHGY